MSDEPSDLTSKDVAKAQQESELTRGLGKLFASDDEGDYIPGEGDSRPPPAALPDLDARTLAELLESGARDSSSASAKSRGLAVASQLFSSIGDGSQALETARDAQESSPKLSFAAMLLRKQEEAEQGLAEQSTESAMRLAAHESSRAHATKMLVQRLRAGGETSRLAKLLDQAAREGSAGPALLLERVLERVAEGESLAGLNFPQELEVELNVALSILSGAATDEQGPWPGLEESPELSLLYAARLLRGSNGASTLAPLWALEDRIASLFTTQELNRAALLELEAALLCSVDESAGEAQNALREALKGAPSRRVTRRLAASYLEAGDRESLQRLLAEADPGSGTFSLEERVFLSASVGEMIEMSDDEVGELQKTRPGLALALAHLDTPAPELAEATSSALLVQLGYGLASMREEPQRAAPAFAALAELKNRQEHPEVVEAVELGLALESDDEERLAHSLWNFARHTCDPRSRLILGTLLERSGAQTDAAELYREAALGSEALTMASRRGLASLEAEDALPQLSTTTSPWLQFSRELALQLSRVSTEASPADSAELALEQCKMLWGLRADGKFESRLVLHAASWAHSLGAAASAEGVIEDLASGKTEASLAARLRLLFTRAEKEGPLQPELLQRLAQGDASERGLAFWLDLPTPAENAGSSRAETLLRLGTEIATGQFDEAARLFSVSESNDAELDETEKELMEVRGESDRLTEEWLKRAQSAATDGERRYAYERLTSLDERRGNTSSAKLWRRTLAEEFPDHMPSLLGLEEYELNHGAANEETSGKLGEHLPPGDRESYRLLDGADAFARSDLRSARRSLEGLLDAEKPHPIALRALTTVARDKRDDPLLLKTLTALEKTAHTDLDRASIALELAHVLARTGEQDEAREAAKRALLQKPGFFSAAQLLFALKGEAEPLQVAEELEGLAAASLHTAHRTELWLECGHRWNELKDAPRAANAFEQVLECSPDSKTAFEELLAIRREEEKQDEVRALIEKRLTRIDAKSAETLQLELSLAEQLIAQGQPEDAKSHLEVALGLQPHNTNALRSHAEVSALLGAHQAAEKSLVALRDRMAPSAERNAVVQSLARLYDEHLGQLERAMDAYQSILKESPGDEAVSSALISVYSRLGLAERATSLQTQLIQNATSQDAKRRGALKLADIYENVGKDIKRAGATLERTRKAWPLDADALEAAILFMDRTGSTTSRGFLLDRTGKEARRNLESGRLDASLLDTLARVAKLSGHHTEAQGCLAARAAYLGSESEALNGAGIHALNSRVDEVIAPRGLAAPLRNLLRKTGAAMDAAFSLDLSRVGAEPLKTGDVFERVTQIAEALKISPPQLFVSPNLGARCVPVTTSPARLLVGSGVAALPGRERDYLLLRGFKLLELGVGALARSRDEDRWPMLVALLQLFAPSWQPKSVDARKAVQAKAAIEQGLARVGYDDDVPTLALEAIGSLGDQTEGLGEATRVLANRSALLAVGDISSVISAISRGEGAQLSPGGPSRFRWLEGHAEARDLILFSSGPKHARARDGLGLSQSQEEKPSPAESVPNASSTSEGASRGAPPQPPRRPKPPPPRR